MRAVVQPLPFRLLSSPLRHISLSLSLSFLSPQEDCRFNISSLSLVRPGLLTYPRPDADTVLTSSIPGDDDLQFQTNSPPPPPPPPSSSPSFFFSRSSSLSSFFPSSGISFARGQMLCTREQGISRFPNYPVLGLKKRGGKKKERETLVEEKSEGRSWLATYTWCSFFNRVFIFMLFSLKERAVVMFVRFRND